MKHTLMKLGFLSAFLCALIFLGTAQIPTILPVSPITENVQFQKEAQFLTNSYYSIIKGSMAEGLAGADLRIGLDKSNRALIICDREDIGTDFGLSAVSNPKLYIYDSIPSSRATLDVYNLDLAGIFSLAAGAGYANLNAPKYVFNLQDNLSSGDSFSFKTNAVTASSGTQSWIYIAPTINQSGTAGYNAILANVTETATGSGLKNLLDLQVAGTSKFRVNNKGLLAYGAEYDNGNSGAADTIDWNNGNGQKSTLTAACTYTFTAPTSGIARLQLRVIQGGTGSYTVTWPATVKWQADTAPTLSTAVGSVDIITFWWDGQYYRGVASVGWTT
jgi:hypothetical protein